MEPTQTRPERFEQPGEDEHPVDTDCPSSDPGGWRPSDAPSSPERIGHQGSEESSPGRQEEHKNRL